MPIFFFYFLGFNFLRLVLNPFLGCQGGSYGMKFGSPDGGFPAPYGDGYRAHMVWMAFYFSCTLGFPSSRCWVCLFSQCYLFA